MGPWVREYKPNPVQSSTHQQPLLFWFFFFTGIHTEMRDSTGSAFVPTPVPFTNLFRSLCLIKSTSVAFNTMGNRDGSSRCVPWFNGSSVILEVLEAGSSSLPPLCNNGSTTALLHSPSHRALTMPPTHFSNHLKSEQAVLYGFWGFYFPFPSFLLLHLRLQLPRSSHLSTSGAAASQLYRQQGFPFIW